MKNAKNPDANINYGDSNNTSKHKEVQMARYKPGKDAKEFMRVRTVWPDNLYCRSNRRQRVIENKRKKGKGEGA